MYVVILGLPRFAFCYIYYSNFSNFSCELSRYPYEYNRYIMHIKTSFLILSNKDYLTNNIGYLGSNAVRINKTITKYPTSSPSKPPSSALYNLGKHEKGGLTESMHNLDSIQHSRLNPHGTITLQMETNLAQSRDLRIRRWDTWRGIHDIIYELVFGVSTPLETKKKTDAKRVEYRKERKNTQSSSTDPEEQVLNYCHLNSLQNSCHIIPLGNIYVYCSPCCLCTSLPHISPLVPVPWLSRNSGHSHQRILAVTGIINVMVGRGRDKGGVRGVTAVSD